MITKLFIFDLLNQILKDRHHPLFLDEVDFGVIGPRELCIGQAEEIRTLMG